jgi:hypothetical protein
MKVVNYKGCVCYQIKASSITKSNRKIYKNNSGVEKYKRGEENFYNSLEKTSHTKKRIARNSKKRLYTM